MKSLEIGAWKQMGFNLRRSSPLIVVLKCEGRIVGITASSPLQHFWVGSLIARPVSFLSVCNIDLSSVYRLSFFYRFSISRGGWDCIAEYLYRRSSISKMSGSQSAGVSGQCGSQHAYATCLPMLGRTCCSINGRVSSKISLEYTDTNDCGGQVLWFE
jgi:hypothetical protein